MTQIIIVPAMVAVSSIPLYIQDFLDRVTAADVAAGNSQGLQSAVVTAISDYLTGMVTTGYLTVSNNVISQAASQIKFLNLYFCARTIQGAMTSVVGPTSTLFGSLAGWNYSQRNGSSGDGITNYMSTGYNNNADGNTKILSITTTAENLFGSGTLIGGRATALDTGQSTIFLPTSGGVRLNVYAPNDSFVTFGTRAVGFYAAARANATQIQLNANGVTSTITNARGTPVSYTQYVLASNDRGNATAFSPAATRVILPTSGTYVDPTQLRLQYLSFRDAIWAAI